MLRGEKFHRPISSETTFVVVVVSLLPGYLLKGHVVDIFSFDFKGEVPSLALPMRYFLFI